MHVCSFTNSNAAVVGGPPAGVCVRAEDGARHVYQRETARQPASAHSQSYLQHMCAALLILWFTSYI